MYSSGKTTGIVAQQGSSRLTPVPPTLGKVGPATFGTHKDPLDMAFQSLKRSRDHNSCKLLFELPAGLISASADRAAAIVDDQSGVHDLFFLTLETQTGKVCVLQPHEVPKAVIDFTRSYAGVLGMIALDTGMQQRRLH